MTPLMPRRAVAVLATAAVVWMLAVTVWAATR